jgi:hypothetical protein
MKNFSLSAEFIFMTFCLGFIINSFSIYAQGEMQDVVYLKNGSIIKGTIIEQIPNESIKIETNEGSIFVYKIEEVSKIIKEKKELKNINEYKSAIIQFSPYFKLGLLIVPPTQDDLGYESWAGCTNQCSNDMKTFNYGFGLKLFTPFKGNFLKVGLDLGWQTLFKNNNSLSGDNNISLYLDQENEKYLFGLISYSFNDNLFELQAGAGIHIVSWTYKYDFINYDNYPDVHTEKGDSDLHFGGTVSGGINLKITDAIELPIMIRLDLIKRYGALINLSTTVGINF